MFVQNFINLRAAVYELSR